jgi:hypothetical protein
MSSENADSISLDNACQKLLLAVEDLISATEGAKEAVLLGNEVEMWFLRAQECATGAKAAFEALEGQKLFPEGLSSIMKEKLGESVGRWHAVMRDFSFLAKSQMDKAENAIYNLKNEKDLGEGTSVVLNDSV